MGKLTPAQRRRSARVKEVAAEVESHLATASQEDELKYAQSKDLFLVDTEGSSRRRRRPDVLKPAYVHSKKFDGSKISRVEQKLLKRLENKAQPREDVVPASSDRINALWQTEQRNPHSPENEDFVGHMLPKQSTRKLVPSTKHKVQAVTIPHPGQSYQPREDDHEDIVAEAVAVELKLQYKRTLHNDDTTTSLESADVELQDAEEESVQMQSVSRKKSRRELKGKLTKTDVNKKRKKRLRVLEQEKESRNKKMLKSINAVHEISKTLTQKEADEQAKQAVLQQWKVEKLLAEPPLKRGDHKDTRPVPVALSDELSGHLRLLRPKANLLTEQYEGLIRRNKVEVGNTGGRRRRREKVIDRYSDQED